MSRSTAWEDPKKRWESGQQAGGAAGTGLATVLRECDWVERAACRPRNGDVFFAEGRRDVSKALQTCAGCPVKAECLTFALAHDERYGIWGGTTPEQRDLIARTPAGCAEDEHRGSDAPPAA